VDPQPAPDPDHLAQLVAGGDREAFLQLYELFSPRVYGLALYMVKDPKLAEEISQETFIKLWTAAGTFRPKRGRFATWLLTIARRTAIDRLRRQSRRPPIADEVDPADDWNLDLAQASSGTEESRWHTLYFALQELPPAQRQAIVLSYYHGLSHSEIATHLGIPLGTAKTRIRLGMEKLRTSWFGSGAGGSKSG
jgi:RNA polymerase sigma-70 factor (ECF subfamily)